MEHATSSELDKLRAEFRNEWGPTTRTEESLVEQLSLAQWRIDQALALDLAAFAGQEADPKKLAFALRYRTAAERAFYKALTELKRLRSANPAPARPATSEPDSSALTIGSSAEPCSVIPDSFAASRVPPISDAEIARRRRRRDRRKNR